MNGGCIIWTSGVVFRTDDKWHHVAVSWKYSTGEVNLYFDGENVKPFWRAANGQISDRDPENGGVSNKLAAKTSRDSVGSLVLGQNQECFAGCFSPASSYDGSMANVRIWDRVLSKTEIAKNMFKKDPDSKDGLVLNFVFDDSEIVGEVERGRRIMDRNTNQYLELGSVAPAFQFSTVPLSDADGVPAELPKPGYMGYVLELTDKQLLMLRNFQNFPSEAITVEFWMWSIDACREGVPFSYAHGEYQSNDNAFLIFNYNNWGISVMEDEGTIDDHNAGFSSTDGKWHHIAVTWESKTGNAVLYDNGIPQWRVSRAKGSKIPAGGTLVIGREQDCLGGCFDSAPGATGDVQAVTNLEYGPQDFYGLIEEVRIWRVARSGSEIYDGIAHDMNVGSGIESDAISKKDPNLVAWWKFDEGSGYTVKDETGHGNTLRILSEPRWVVPNWVHSCGNGILEATERCDDGNRVDGDGCSSKCFIEKDYFCTLASPSICTRQRSDSTPSTTRRHTPTHEGSSSRSHADPKESHRDSQRASRVYTNTEVDSEIPEEVPHKKKGKSGVATFFIVLFVFAILAFIAFIVYRKREAIYEYAPGVRTVVQNTQDRINSAFGRSYHRYDLAAVDPEEAYISPGFVDSQPPAANRASGGNVPYEPIGDETTRLNS